MKKHFHIYVTISDISKVKWLLYVGRHQGHWILSWGHLLFFCWLSKLITMDCQGKRGIIKADWSSFENFISTAIVHSLSEYTLTQCISNIAVLLSGLQHFTIFLICLQGFSYWMYSGYRTIYSVISMPIASAKLHGDTSFIIPHSTLFINAIWE